MDLARLEQINAAMQRLGPQRTFLPEVSPDVIAALRGLGGQPPPPPPPQQFVPPPQPPFIPPPQPQFVPPPLPPFIPPPAPQARTPQPPIPNARTPEQQRLQQIQEQLNRMGQPLPPILQQLQMRQRINPFASIPGLARMDPRMLLTPTGSGGGMAGALGGFQPYSIMSDEDELGRMY